MTRADVLVALLAALAPTLAVIVSSLLSRKQVDKRADASDEGIAKVHFLVNGRLDESLARIKHLEEALGLEPGQAIGLTSTVKEAIDIREDK